MSPATPTSPPRTSSPGARPGCSLRPTSCSSGGQRSSAARSRRLEQGKHPVREPSAHGDDGAAETDWRGSSFPTPGLPARSSISSRTYRRHELCATCPARRRKLRWETWMRNRTGGSPSDGCDGIRGVRKRTDNGGGWRCGRRLNCRLESGTLPGTGESTARWWRTDHGIDQRAGHASGIGRQRRRPGDGHRTGHEPAGDGHRFERQLLPRFAATGRLHGDLQRSRVSNPEADWPAARGRRRPGLRDARAFLASARDGRASRWRGLPRLCDVGPIGRRRPRRRKSDVLSGPLDLRVADAGRRRRRAAGNELGAQLGWGLPFSRLRPGRRRSGRTDRQEGRLRGRLCRPGNAFSDPPRRGRFSSRPDGRCDFLCHGRGRSCHSGPPCLKRPDRLELVRPGRSCPDPAGARPRQSLCPRGLERSDGGLDRGRCWQRHPGLLRTRAFHSSRRGLHRRHAAASSARSTPTGWPSWSTPRPIPPR